MNETSVTSPTGPPEAAPPARPGPRGTLWALRITAVLTSLLTVAQPLFAGYYLDGDVDAIDTHGINAHLVSGLIFVQAVVALLFWTVGRGKGWPALAQIPFFLLVGFQIGMGYSKNLALHVPIGVAIVLLQLALTVWVFTAFARRPRSWGGRR